MLFDGVGERLSDFETGLISTKIFFLFALYGDNSRNNKRNQVNKLINHCYVRQVMSCLQKNTTIQSNCGNFGDMIGTL